MLFSWYYQPIISAGGDSDTNSLAPTIFDLRGVALADWTLAAFAIGVVAGILIRRVIPAMFATLAVWIGLAFLTGAYLRPHYEAPLVTSNPNIANVWMIKRAGVTANPNVGFRPPYPLRVPGRAHAFGSTAWT
jgi:hypothetical protein